MRIVVYEERDYATVGGVQKASCEGRGRFGPIRRNQGSRAAGNTRQKLIVGMAERRSEGKGWEEESIRIIIGRSGREAHLGWSHAWGWPVSIWKVRASKASAAKAGMETGERKGQATAPGRVPIGHGRFLKTRWARGRVN